MRPGVYIIKGNVALKGRKKYQKLMNIQCHILRSLTFSLPIVFVFAFIAHAQTKTEITTTDVPTLIGKKSTQFSVLGFDVTMTRAQAEAKLKASKTLMPFGDAYNAGRIYVYSKKADGTKDKCLLYLIWDGKVQMKQLTVFEDMIGQLAPNFKRLLTFEKNASKEKADFIMEFIGAPDRKDITLDVASIGLKHTTYFYDEIGFEMTHKVSSTEETSVFALVQPKGAIENKAVTKPAVKTKPKTKAKKTYGKRT